MARDAEAVREQIADRDRRDRTRAESPLTQAPDAVYLDTTRLVARRGGGGDSEADPRAHHERKEQHDSESRSAGDEVRRNQHGFGGADPRGGGFDR